MTDDELEALLDRAAAGSRMPPVARELLDATQAQQTTAADVEALLSGHPPLAGQVLELANSSFYGFPRKLTGIAEAALALGFDEVGKLAMVCAVVRACAPEGELQGFELVGFWEHAIGTAITAELLADHCGSSYRSDAFLAGFCHAIGKLLIATQLPELYAQIRERLGRCELWQEAEAGLLPGGHARLGAQLARRWGFPERLAAAIGSYLEPGADHQHRGLSCLVHAADIFARALDLGDPGDAGVPAIAPAAWDHAQLDERSLDQLFDRVVERWRHADALRRLVREERP